MDLRDKAKSAPQSPGVYFMKDALGIIIYVGKSKNFRQRLGQYFGVSTHKSPKTEKMVTNIQDFEYRAVDTELEAFLLESKLIKELKPRYNRQIKKFMEYPYIEVSVDRRFPEVRVVQEMRNPGSLYFGPYRSLDIVERVIEVLRESIWLRSGKTNEEAITWNTLKEQLGHTIVPLKDENWEEYNQYMDRVIMLLRGDDGTFLCYLKSKMDEASINYRFEEAAKYRDALKALKYVINTNRIVNEAKKRKVLIALEVINRSLGKAFIFSGSDLLYSELINLHQDIIRPYISFLESKISDYYRDDTGSEDTVFSKAQLDDAHIIHTYLKNQRGPARYFEIDDSYFSEVEGKSRLIQDLECLFDVGTS